MIKSLRNHFLFFGYPIVFFFIFKIWVSVKYKAILLDTVENSIFALLLIFLSYTLLFKIKIQNSFLFFLFIYYFILFAETTYFYLFDIEISASALFVFFETNSQETKEFIITKFDYKLGLLFVVYILFNIWAIVRVKTINKTISLKYKYSIGIIFLLLAFLKISWLLNYNLPYTLVRSSFRYAKALRKLDQLSSTVSKGVLHNVKDLFPEERQTHIVIVGESTNRSHFSLYEQYDRNTTPELNDLKKELSIYNDVISPHANTIASLQKVLTRDHYERSYHENNASIIQLLNEAGYNTYWLSNQRPLDVWSTMITKVAKASDSIRFFNTEHTMRAKQLDEVLLEPCREAVKSSKGKTVIFLHILGTHADYIYRYPKTFERFQDVVAEKTARQNEIVNTYDNSILYNDYIVSQIIKMAKVNGVSSVLYFSDHGEEVYDTLDFHGHAVDTDDVALSEDMFKIPFLLWRSDDFKRREDLVFETNRTYMIDDLFHSVAHLLGVTADEVDIERSIFSPNFVSRKRIIGRNIDFDTYFK